MFYSGIYSSKKNTQKIKNCLKSWQQKLEGWRKTLRNSVHSYKVRLEGMIMVCQIRGWGQHLQQKNILQERCIGVQFLKAKARWTQIQGWGLVWGFFERTVVAHVPYLQRWLILYLKFLQQEFFFFLTDTELLDILLLLMKSVWSFMTVIPRLVIRWVPLTFTNGDVGL